MAGSNPKVYTFINFIEEFSLPQVVKVVEGGSDSEGESTLSVLDVIRLHMLKNCETVKITDEKNHEFHVPLNSPAKVRVLLNPKYQKLYRDVKTLAQDFPMYIQSKDNDPWLNIEKGDVLKLIEIITNPHDEMLLRCECTNKEQEDILIPFTHKVRFKTLGDFQHSLLFLKEVVVNAPTFPLQIKFHDNCLKVRRPDINAGFPTGFKELGPFTLQETYVMKLVVATLCRDEHGSRKAMLLTIPHDLDIKVIRILGESADNQCQIERSIDSRGFKIDFNKTSFKYGCNVIERQGHVQCDDDTVKPLPHSQDCVTPGVTLESSRFREKVNSTHGDDNSQKKENETKFKTKSLSYENVEKREEPIYVDMSYCVNVELEEKPYANSDESVPVIKQYRRTSKDEHDGDDSAVPLGRLSRYQEHSIGDKEDIKYATYKKILRDHRPEAERIAQQNPNTLLTSISTTLQASSHSTSQTQYNKFKSRIRKTILKKIKNTSRNEMKSSKSMTDEGEYHFVSSIPGAKADRKADISMFLSQESREKVHRHRDLSTLTVEEVSDSLRNLNLSRYIETFKANDVDGSILMDLDDKSLDELKMTSELDRSKIRMLQNEYWNPEYHH